ncbi:hypothetical protein F511_16959 [Dorcoceras hygrometricum]|uniref:Uncharacterized protein n=1 Tax=Dorcoceras hygrometricum TaxID=472368 RepID=A0A2Z7BUQ8_9LAMI|nr:hypothetical protein F511_16959 [Dorcoceras hygrometricum]
MAPDRDVRVLRKAHNADVVGHFSSHVAAVVAWGGEMVKRLTKAHQKMNASRDQFDKAMGQHARGARPTRGVRDSSISGERGGGGPEGGVRGPDAGGEGGARSREGGSGNVGGRARGGKKAGGFFKNGFFGCVAQWRANGYPEEEHPASFLNVQQAIAEMPDEEEVQEEEEDEDEEEGGNGSEATPSSSPLS